MTDNEIIKAFDILDKFEFFGGQRAGRELWFNKPADIQEKDIGEFLRDIDFLNQFIGRQKAEIERLTKENDEFKNGFFQEHYKENECQELLSVKEARRKESLHNIDLEAEIERLKKKDNEWALSYVNSVARGILEREEAIKKFEEKVEDVLAPTVSALFCISETLVEASKQHISPEEALKNIRVQLSEKQPICSKLQLEEVLDKCVKEMED